MKGKPVCKPCVPRAEELQKGYDKTEEAFKSASITLGKLGEDIKKHLGSIDNKRNVSIPTSVPVFRPPPLKVVPLSGKTIGDAFSQNRCG